jgi:hypothetical protein
MQEEDSETKTHKKEEARPALGKPVSISKSI